MLRRRQLGAAVVAAMTVKAASAQIQPQASALPRGDDWVAPGMRRDVVIRWGDRVEFDSPVFTPDAITAEAAATQFGWDAEVIGLLAAQQGEDGVPRALLAVAHPQVQARMAFPRGIDRPGIAAAMQGASLINLEQREGRWSVVDGGFQSRRLTGSSLCRLSGPATGLVGTAIQGVLAVEGGCITPWGTLLLAEGDPQPWFDRLRDADERFPHSAHASAYGWMVELDAFDPQAVPVKRTGLGRFVHGGAACALSKDGRAVVLMSEGRERGALFRFVSERPMGGEAGDVLDAGTMSVAVIEGLTLRFVPLAGMPSTLVEASRAARALNAAQFDRPAGVTIGVGGAVFLACRGVAQRSATDALHPRLANPDGHVLVFRPDGGDVAAPVFGGEILLLGGDSPANGGMLGESGSSFVTKPSAVAVAPSGALWIAGVNGLVNVDANGLGLRQIYAAPDGSAIGGVVVAADGTVLTAAAHPGALSGASFERPGTRWPSLKPGEPPRSTVVAIRA